MCEAKPPVTLTRALPDLPNHHVLDASLVMDIGSTFLLQPAAGTYVAYFPLLQL